MKIVITDKMIEAAKVVLRQQCPSVFLSLDDAGQHALLCDIYIAMETNETNPKTNN